MVITEGESLQVTHCPVLARSTPQGPVLEAHFARTLGIETKFMRGQNRSREDQLSVPKHLEDSPDPQSRDLAGFMREFGGLAE